MSGGERQRSDRDGGGRKDNADRSQMAEHLTRVRKKVRKKRGEEKMKGKTGDKGQG